MKLTLLTCSLLALLAALVLDWPVLLAVAVVTALASLTSLGRVPWFLPAVFWIWVLGVLLHLLRQEPPGPDSPLLGGLPRGAFWMLLGIWIAPLLLWPLGFLLGFRKWLGR